MEPSLSPGLQSISSPAEVFAPLLKLVDVQSVVSITALVLFVFWLIYTVVSAYHLIRYGYRSSVSIPAIIVHVVVSLTLALFIASGLQ